MWRGGCRKATRKAGGDYGRKDGTRGIVKIQWDEERGGRMEK